MSDGRLDFMEKENAPDSVRKIYDGVESKFGIVLNIIKTMGHSPPGLKTGLDVIGISGDFELSDKYAELAYLKATEVNECHY